VPPAWRWRSSSSSRRGPLARDQRPEARRARATLERPFKKGVLVESSLRKRRCRVISGSGSSTTFDYFSTARYRSLFNRVDPIE